MDQTFISKNCFAEKTQFEN